MPPLERKVALMRARITQAEIARRAGVSLGHVHEVLHDRRRSPRTEQQIAAALDLKHEDVFGPPPEKQPLVRTG